jgi:hypothetical protein
MGKKMMRVFYRAVFLCFLFVGYFMSFFCGPGATAETITAVFFNGVKKIYIRPDNRSKPIQT